MLQGLAQLCIALVKFFEQPHVLDRDHSLIGEGLQKSDLFVGRRDELRFGECESPPMATPSRNNGVLSTVRVPDVC